MKDLLTTADLSTSDFMTLLNLSHEFKRHPTMESELLKNQTVAMYFSKPSTRTRISFATAIARLGGTALALSPNELQLGRGETIADTARVLSRYCSAFIIRTFKDNDVAEFAKHATIPVINALTDLHHPCQSLADLLTVDEKIDKPLHACKIAYVGDGNNVAHSLMQACALVGCDFSIATPKGYEAHADIVKQAQAIAAQTNSNITITHDPHTAVANADAIYTDVWLSMGDDETTKAERLSALQPYQVNAALMQAAANNAIFMHCLPAHRDEEVSSDVMDGPSSVVFDQAENRLHTATALLYALVAKQLSV